MKKVIPNQTYNMHEIGVVLKGYQINNAMENAWSTFHSYNDGKLKGDLQIALEVFTLQYIKEGHY